MKKTMMTFLFLLATQLAHAGDKIQNGGNVIVCKNTQGSVQSVELLDYYELRLSGKSLQFNPALTTYAEKLNELLGRWSKVAPKRMALYLSWLNDFEKEAGLYPGIEIPDIPDTGSIVIPKGCEVTPVAFQRRDEDIFPGEKRYVINQDLWNLMNADQKVGLVLHELIYREAIKSQHETSLPTRFFNGFLSSETTINADAYFEIVNHMPLQWAEFGGGLVVEIGEVRCTSWPNTGCRFYRELKFEAGSMLNGKVLELLGPVESSLISFEAEGAYCDFTTRQDLSGKIQIIAGEYINFRNCFPFKKISVPKLVHLVFLENKVSGLEYSVRIGSRAKLYLNDRNTIDTVSTDPKVSWIINSNGETIQDISHVEKFGARISTSNAVWDYDDRKSLYSLNDFHNKKYVFKLKNTVITCTKKLDEKKIYDCTGIPASFVCQAKVRGGNAEYISVTYRPKDVARLSLEEELSPKGPTMTLSLFMPSGTITSYDKKLGRNKANVLNVDDWVFFKTDEKGTCWVQSF